MVKEGQKFDEDISDTELLNDRDGPSSEYSYTFSEERNDAAETGEDAEDCQERKEELKKKLQVARKRKRT